jgi:hypothetical protein
MQVSEVNHNPPIGKSDHDVLSFSFHCYVDFTKKKERYIFERGDYQAMKESDSIKTWREEFLKTASNTHNNPETMWCSIKGQLHHLTNLFVPLQTASNKPTWKDKGSIPIDEKARLSIKKKRKKPSDVDVNEKRTN